MSLKRLVKGIGALTAFLLLTSCSVFSQILDGGGPFAEADVKKIDAEIRLRNDIVDFAHGYIGTKYRSAGKSPSGFDCSGFVYFVMKEFGIQMAASSGTQERQGRKINKLEAQPGDLVFFRRSSGGRVFHVAMVVDNDEGDISIIHSTSRGVIVDRIRDSAYWRSKVMTFRNIVSEK